MPRRESTRCAITIGATRGSDAKAAIHCDGAEPMDCDVTVHRRGGALVPKVSCSDAKVERGIRTAIRRMTPRGGLRGGMLTPLRRAASSAFDTVSSLASAVSSAMPWVGTGAAKNAEWASSAHRLLESSADVAAPTGLLSRVSSALVNAAVSVWTAASALSPNFAALWRSVVDGTASIFSATGAVSWPLVFGLILGAGLVRGGTKAWFTWRGKVATDALIAEVMEELRRNPREGAAAFRRLVRSTPDAVCRLLTQFDVVTVSALIDKSDAMTTTEFMRLVESCRTTGRNVAVSPRGRAPSPRRAAASLSYSARLRAADEDAMRAADVADQLLALLDKTTDAVRRAPSLPSGMRATAARMRKSVERFERAVDEHYK